MRTASMIRAGWVSVCLFAFATVSLAQGAPTPTPLRIAYTGSLLGYFRVPAKQARDKFQGCPNVAGVNSDAANTFLFKTRSLLYRGAVLVGTGDNFSPHLEARTFAAGSGQGAGGYEPRNKELYSWDKAKEQWVPIGAPEDEKLKELLALGEGTIPTDNVGCFLAAAGFSAVVPSPAFSNRECVTTAHSIANPSTCCASFVRNDCGISSGKYALTWPVSLSR